MAADVIKQGGYVVVGKSGDASAANSQLGYAVSSQNGAISGARGLAVLSNAAAITTSKGITVLANPATVTAASAYTVFGAAAAYTYAAPAYAVIQSFYPPVEDLELIYGLIEQRFPACVSYGSQGGPGFKTSVFTFDSGLTATEPEWERIRARYEATFENATPEDVSEVEEFFYGMRGRAVGFRYKDWSDYVIANQNVAVGDGTSTAFQVFKRYESGGYIFDRIIKKTVAGTSQITVDGSALLEGSDYFMLDASGQIVFSTPPASGAIVSISYLEFDVPVRFDTDYLNVSYDDFQQLNMTIPLVEVLV